jgi:hypothetical protein
VEPSVSFRLTCLPRQRLPFLFTQGDLALGKNFFFRWLGSNTYSMNLGEKSYFFIPEFRLSSSAVESPTLWNLD